MLVNKALMFHFIQRFSVASTVYLNQAFLDQEKNLPQKFFVVLLLSKLLALLFLYTLFYDDIWVCTRFYLNVQQNVVFSLLHLVLSRIKPMLRDCFGLSWWGLSDKNQILAHNYPAIRLLLFVVVSKVTVQST